jgi:flagellar biosynthetic protein FliR
MGIFLITPIFSSGVIVNRVKIGFSFLLALITLPIIQETQSLQFPDHGLLIVADILKELSIGFLMGFTVLLTFSAIQLAGQYIDMRMAFRMANTVNPMTNSQTPLVGQFKNIMAVLVFLAINGHHILIYNLYKSFTIISLGKVAYNKQLFKYIFRGTADIFILSFKIALPVIGTIFIVDVILGFLARAVPQMNLFIIGLPVKILVGFIFLLLSISAVVHFYSDIFNQMFDDIMKLLHIMGGG